MHEHVIKWISNNKMWINMDFIIKINMCTCTHMWCKKDEECFMLWEVFINIIFHTHTHLNEWKII